MHFISKITGAGKGDYAYLIISPYCIYFCLFVALRISLIKKQKDPDSIMVLFPLIAVWLGARISWSFGFLIYNSFPDPLLSSRCISPTSSDISTSTISKYLNLKETNLRFSTLNLVLFHHASSNHLS